MLEASNLVKYLTDRIKVKGKAGALGKDVEVALDKKDAYLVSVSSSGDVSLSKRYIKYCEWFSLSYFIWGGWVVPPWEGRPHTRARAGSHQPVHPCHPFSRTHFSPTSLFFAVTKKYLKNQKIKEYVRVVSCKGGYEMKYFNIQADGDEVRTYFGL